MDALEEDGGRGRALNVIAFLGGVFSPWYAWSGRRDPDDNCCMHVVTYGPGGRWAMTDRGRARLRQEEARIDIGASSMRWEGGRVVVDVDERAWPHMERIRGTVTLTPRFVTEVERALTPDGTHVWRPFAPRAEVEVDLGRHGRWRGHGYFDANFGLRPLEEDFDYWVWGRFPDGDGAIVVYDADLADGTKRGMAARFAPDGSVTPVPIPRRMPLPRSRWGVRREAWADAGHAPRQSRAMLGAPFYNRAAIETVLGGVRTEGVHESIDLRRWGAWWMKPMAMMRVPRRR
ncbi:carotenoid 1,2-hydratase [Hasllibacter halocynthiae]|uniref:Carotenoid 1,2-hydratase n=1 Tax=Hasllibacter halocynthiae TaxID=595589 RepID=A0A2T0X2V8_9RHOB|nr:carotenoid 1,2-hydratase [Hasllibacter halocynthiae]PRY93268.1 carotenoid 1,2-hydratase [Hasllibacter halocynthiae]